MSLIFSIIIYFISFKIFNVISTSILISIFSYLLGVFSVIIFSIMRISSKCSIAEERAKEDYGQIAYDELERLENERNKK